MGRHRVMGLDRLRLDLNLPRRNIIDTLRNNIYKFAMCMGSFGERERGVFFFLVF